MLVGHGYTDYGFDFTLVNNAEIKDTDTESIRLDGESYFLDFRLRHRVHERLELGVDVPFVKHSAGVFDDAIFDWHDFWGMSNSKRDGVNNNLDYRYSNNGSVERRITSSSSGIGDVQLSAAVPLMAGAEDGSRHVAMRIRPESPSASAALAIRLVSIFDHFISAERAYKRAFNPAWFRLKARSLESE